jgi:hypothetical protein
MGHDVQTDAICTYNLSTFCTGEAQERLQRALDTALAESTAAEQRVTALAAELSSSKLEAAAVARRHDAALQAKDSALGKRSTNSMHQLPCLTTLLCSTSCCLLVDSRACACALEWYSRMRECAACSLSANQYLLLAEVSVTTCNRHVQATYTVKATRFKH